MVCTGQYHRNPLYVHSGSRRCRDVRGRPSRLWDATSACDMKIDLTQAVCKRVEVEVERVHDGGFGEILWRRVLLSDAASEDSISEMLTYPAPMRPANVCISEMESSL